LVQHVFAIRCGHAFTIRCHFTAASLSDSPSRLSTEH
jgi:hypothetical protein